MPDDELYQGILNREESTFHLIIKEYSPLLWSIASSMLKNSSDIEEIVSDTFIRLWKHPKKYDPNRGSLKNYLALIIKSLCLNHLKKKEFKTCDIDDFSNTLIAKTHSENSNKEFWETFYKAIMTLEEPTREICLRRFFYEMKPSEIHDIMKISKKEIDNQLYRGKKQIKELSDTEEFLLRLEDY